MKTRYRLSILILLSSASLLVGCNGGTTNNYNTIVGCQLPIFNKGIGNSMLQKWGASVKQYGSNNYSDIYIGAGYFTMDNYTSDAILLPTVSAIQREGTQEIYDYFTNFLVLNPIMSLPAPESNVFASLGCGYGGASGYYDFITNPGTAQESIVHARFTFIYKYESQPFNEAFIVEFGSQMGQTISQTNAPGWYVWAQHSSALPVDH